MASSAVGTAAGSDVEYGGSLCDIVAFMPLDREALRRAIEALRPLGVVLREPLGEPRPDAIEMALAEFHRARDDGWSVYAYAIFLPRPRTKRGAGAVEPPHKIEVHADRRENIAAASRALVEHLGGVGLVARWSGDLRAPVELLVDTA